MLQPTSTRCFLSGTCAKHWVRMGSFLSRQGVSRRIQKYSNHVSEKMKSKRPKKIKTSTNIIYSTFLRAYHSWCVFFVGGRNENNTNLLNGPSSPPLSITRLTCPVCLGASKNTGCFTVDVPRWSRRSWCPSFMSAGWTGRSQRSLKATQKTSWTLKVPPPQGPPPPPRKYHGNHLVLKK